MLTVARCSGHVANKPMTPDVLHSYDIKTPLPLPSTDLFFTTALKMMYWQNNCNTNHIKGTFNLERCWGYSVWLEKQRKEVTGLTAKSHGLRVQNAKIITLGTKWRTFSSLRHAQTEQKLSLWNEAHPIHPSSQWASQLGLVWANSTNQNRGQRRTGNM